MRKNRGVFSPAQQLYPLLQDPGLAPVQTEVWLFEQCDFIFLRLGGAVIWVLHLPPSSFLFFKWRREKGNVWKSQIWLVVNPDVLELWIEDWLKLSPSLLRTSWPWVRPFSGQYTDIRWTSKWRQDLLNSFLPHPLPLFFLLFAEKNLQWFCHRVGISPRPGLIGPFW